MLITTPRDNVPPSFSNTTVWQDTSYSGPFEVSSTVTDNMYDVDQCSLYYRVNNGTWHGLKMNLTGNPDEYAAVIPAQSIHDTIDYYLAARDYFLIANRGTDPLCAPDEGFYSFVIKSLVGISEEKIERFFLYQNCPNPFKKSTTISYALPMKSTDDLKDYNALGALVRTLVQEVQMPGYYSVLFEPRDNMNRNLATGIYFLKFSADNVCFTRKTVLLK